MPRRARRVAPGVCVACVVCLACVCYPASATGGANILYKLFFFFFILHSSPLQISMASANLSRRHADKYLFSFCAF
jgi:hypothetical protein